MTHFGARKTKARRAAINKRAAEHPRPLSIHQLAALQMMARGWLARTRAGWSNEFSGIAFWPTPTITALVKRGLSIIHARRFAVITPAGRRELARRR